LLQLQEIVSDHPKEHNVMLKKTKMITDIKAISSIPTIGMGLC
jgi:hypothetical protein